MITKRYANGEGLIDNPVPSLNYKEGLETIENIFKLKKYLNGSE